MFKCIVAALDGSEQSMLALKYARGIAESYGAKLLLVHVYPHTSDLRDSTEYGDLVARRKMAGHQIMEKAREQLGEISIEVEEDLLEGPPADAILAAAEIRKADLIVLGTRGMGSLKGLVFGSVSSKVSQYASCPVMVVR